ncbi:hypothetical protein HYT26_02420 [Candidatus Pacearchaeota archaeon]|nr:hypothetical protein [Candidatus Pacearchaeota archaeon]
MKSQDFEIKYRRIQELESTIHHQTTLLNAISALEHGLMPIEELERKGMKFEWGGYVYDNPHNRPDAVAFHKFSRNNSLRNGETAAFLSSKNSYLILDDKYAPLLEEEYPAAPHPTVKVYKGTIPSKDILAMVVPIESTMKEFKLIDEHGKVTIHSNSRDREWIFKPIEEAMELQRKKLSPHKLTPLYYMHNDWMYGGDDRAYLYVPDWLEVSSDIKAQARPLEPFSERQQSN